MMCLKIQYINSILFHMPLLKVTGVKQALTLLVIITFYSHGFIAKKKSTSAQALLKVL